MGARNFSMNEWFQRYLAEHEPLLAFRGKTADDWRAWRDEALPKYLELIGEFPKPVDLNAEVEYAIEEDGVIRERVVFDSERWMSVPCYVLRPAEMKADRSNAAIICSHGHGRFGKEAVSGARHVYKEFKDAVAQANYDYGMQMARAGFLTLSLDLRLFAERSEGWQLPFGGPDRCNVEYVRATMLGLNTLALNIWDVKRCVDYLATRPEVDAGRIGMMGLSQGGTMTTFAAAAEPRIRAADIIGYVNAWRRFAFDRGNICGSQVLPGILKYLDAPDIAGLIAPRPLLLEMGAQDDCFLVKDMLAGYDAVRSIYSAAGVEDDLHADLHPGGHAFAGGKAFEFFRRYL